VGTVEKLTLKNMGIAFGILSLDGTEPEIHLGGSFIPPSATYVLKNTIATLGLKSDKGDNILMSLFDCNVKFFNCYAIF